MLLKSNLFSNETHHYEISQIMGDLLEKVIYYAILVEFVVTACHFDNVQCIL